MSVIDFHSHFFSHTYFETLAAQSPRPGTTAEKLAALAQTAGIEIPRAGLAEHLERWLREMDRHQVEHLCSFGSVPEETPVVVEAAALARGRLSAFALVNPRAEGAAERMQALLAAGRIRGCLVFPALHHYRIDGPEAAALLKVLEQQRAILYVHCGLLVVKVRDLLGLPRVQDLRHADPLHVIPAANAHPDLRFVIPPLRRGLPARDALRRRAVPERLRRQLVLELLADDAGAAPRAARGLRARAGGLRPAAHPVRHRLEHLPRRLAPRALRRAARGVGSAGHERERSGTRHARQRAPAARAGVSRAAPRGAP
jgi:hypothetical protein